MKKKYLFWLFLLILVITGVLIVIGLLFNKSENQKQNGLANQYDVSSQGTIAYVIYNDGKPKLRLYNKDLSINATAFELEEDSMIFDPSFSKDGSQLAFTSTNKDKKKTLTSTVYTLDLSTKKVTKLFRDFSTITEVEFSPSRSFLYYLRAGTFKNYSPIAGARPHDFDIYQFDLSSKNQEQLTNMKQYSMESLNISPNGKKLFIQMGDDANAKTAEDTFNVKQRIFEIPVDSPSQMKVITDPKRSEDIYSFTFTPDGNNIIFQSVSNANTGDTFQYELYQYNLDSKKESQLTYMEEYTERPVVKEKKVFFIVDKQFGKKDPEYHLYEMNMEGKDIHEISLPTS